MVTLLPAQGWLQPDVVIANVENIAHGRITQATLQPVLDAGRLRPQATMCGQTRSILVVAGRTRAMVRPANHPAGAVGQGAVFTVALSVLVINLLAVCFWRGVDSPFPPSTKFWLNYACSRGRAIIDFHAEATSEKQAMGWHVDGRVSQSLVHTRTFADGAY